MFENGGRSFDRLSNLCSRNHDTNALTLIASLLPKQKRHEARQRMRSMALFRSLEIARATEAVADRAYDGTISLRRDRVMHADVGLSGALIDLVRSG